jgi:hypothetical protein
MTTTIAPLQKGLFTEGAYQVPPYVTGEVLEINLGQLVPTPHGAVAANNPLDQWLARYAAGKMIGSPGAVRLFFGRGPNAVLPTAAWLALGSVQVYDPIDGKTSTVNRWWEADVQAAQKDAVAKLAAKYDGLFSLLFIANGGTTYAEPFIRGIQSDQTRHNLIAAGYTKQADQDSYVAGYEMFRAWHVTRLAQAFNPYQYVNPDGYGGVDVSFTLAMMDEFAAIFPRRAALQNNSIRTALAWGGQTPPLYQTMYDHMKQLHQTTGRALRFQTATQQRVGSFTGVLDWALAQGAHAVELSPGFQNLSVSPHLTTAQQQQYDSALRAVA